MRAKCLTRGLPPAGTQNQGHWYVGAAAGVEANEPCTDAMTFAREFAHAKRTAWILSLKLLLPK